MANPSTLRHLLQATSVPADLVDELVAAGTAWLVGVPDEVAAAEAVLCHPPVGPGEVRAVANPTGRPGVHRLTVVTTDRTGLLADSTGLLAAEGVSVLDATTAVLPRRGLALQRLAVEAAWVADGDEAAWGRVGARLRRVLGSGEEVVTPPWEPAGPVTVETQPQGEGAVVITVHAPDRPGLLHALTSWLGDRHCSIDSCHASTDGPTATDVLVVRGDPDPSALAAHLGGVPTVAGHGGWYPVRVVVDAWVGAVTLPWRAGRAVRGAVRDGVRGAVRDGVRGGARDGARGVRRTHR